MIGQQQFAASRGNDKETRRVEPYFQPGKRWSLDQQIVTVRLIPAAQKFVVVDEDIQRAGCVGSIFQVGLAAIQQQRGAVGVEEYRGKRVVSVILNQLTGRSFDQCFS